MPNFVQEYRSTDIPAWPTLNGVAGALTTLLDAVLVNGGTTSSVTSLTEAGATVTALIPANTTLETNDYLVIAGASPAGANGTFKVTVLDSTHFTYTGPGSLGTITGSITYKRAPLGWTKPFSGTNIAAYLPQLIVPFPQFYLRVDDSNTIPTTGGAKESAVRGYETMTDINTGTGPFPTVAQLVNGLCWRKSTTADATARTWTIIGDGATFYFVPNSDNNAAAGRGLYGFGGFVPFKSGDAYNAAISGGFTFNSSTPGGFTACTGLGTSFTITTGLYVARLSTQTGAAISVEHLCRTLRSVGTGTLGAISNFVNWPNLVDGSLWIDSTLILESANSPRGRPRGFFGHCHTTLPITADYDIVTNVAGLPGITLVGVLISQSAAGVVLFDKYGPW